MALTWSERRKLLYIIVMGVVAVAILIFVYEKFLARAPTCTDGIQNGEEHGVDCGGTCALLCRGETRAPVVLWARAFPSGDQLYTATVYVQNNNPSAGARHVGYMFQLYTADNKLIVERDGVTDLYPTQVTPVIELNIPVGAQTVARTLFTFTEDPQWERADLSHQATLASAKQNFESDGSRLDVTISNSSVVDAPSVTVVGVLFDTQGVARAASKSLIGSLMHKSSQDVTFTWPMGVALPVGGIARAEVTILPTW